MSARANHAERNTFRQIGLSLTSKNYSPEGKLTETPDKFSAYTFQINIAHSF
jgi:hypothetical protein